MNVINASVSFLITKRFIKEDLDNQIIDYSRDIEDLLDYDCNISEPQIVKEDDDSITLRFPVDAYLEILDENEIITGKEEKEVKDGAFQLETILKDGLDGEIAIVDIKSKTSSFSDLYSYKNWVLMDSILMLLANDIEFEESFKALIFDDSSYEITGAHICGEGLYFQGINDEGEHFILGLKYAKEKNEKDFELLKKHLGEIYPEGEEYIVEIVENGKSDEEWDTISEDDEYLTYTIAISLKDLENDHDGFYAADSLLCCIDDEYESQIDEEWDEE